MSETWNLFHKALEQVGVRGVATELNLHVGTVKNWLKVESVPDQYWFDFARILCTTLTTPISLLKRKISSSLMHLLLQLAMARC